MTKAIASGDVKSDVAIPEVGVKVIKIPDANRYLFGQEIWNSVGNDRPYFYKSKNSFG